MERVAVQLRLPEELPPGRLFGLARATRELGVPLPAPAIYRANTIGPRQLELMRREERRRFVRDRAEDQRRMREDWAAWGLAGAAGRANAVPTAAPPRAAGGAGNPHVAGRAAGAAPCRGAENGKFSGNL